MNSVKEAAAEVLREAPDSVTFDDLMYRLYVRSKIERSLQAVIEGRVVSQEEAEKRTSRSKYRDTSYKGA